MNEQQWNQPNVEPIHLAGGRIVETEVNGKAMDGRSGYVFVGGRDIKVKRNASDEWEEVAKESRYYLAVGDHNRAEKLRDCLSDDLDQAEREAVEEFEKLQKAPNAPQLLRVIDSGTRVVERAITADNVARAKQRMSDQPQPYSIQFEEEKEERTMQQKNKFDSKVAHRQAGLVAAFMWQDEAAEGHLDAKSVEIDYTTVLGTLPDDVNGAPVYLVHVQGTVTSTFGYPYSIERTLKVYIPDSEDEEARGPTVTEATEEEEKAVEQHNRDKACKEYAELSHIVEVGAYSEGDNGEYWYPDEENGINVGARLLELECNAFEQGLHFAPSSPVRSDGYADTYKLEPATAEELEAYRKAKEEAEAAEEEAEAEEFEKQRQAERLAFLEKRVQELANEIALHHIVEQNQPSLQVVILDREPQPQHPNGWKLPRPDKFLSEHTRNLIDQYPGMLFTAGLHLWQVGLTLEKQKIVFVPDSLYSPYEKECLQAVGWTPQQNQEWEDSITEEDEETGDVYTPDWPNPLERKGKWKARQVAHWTGEEATTPEVDHSVWANGTWG